MPVLSSDESRYRLQRAGGRQGCTYNVMNTKHLNEQTDRLVGVPWWRQAFRIMVAWIWGMLQRHVRYRDDTLTYPALNVYDSYLPLAISLASSSCGSDLLSMTCEPDSRYTHYHFSFWNHILHCIMQSEFSCSISFLGKVYISRMACAMQVKHIYSWHHKYCITIVLLKPS